MEIGGHTDSQGREEMNLGLSQSRADAVLNGLLARGVLVSNLTARGYGETRPIADNETEEGRERNRRIEFRLQDVVDARDAAEAEAEAEAARLEAYGLRPVQRPDDLAAPPNRRTTKTRSNRRMDRLQFIIAIAVILFVAFGLGWLAHWLVARFSRVSSADLGEMEALARALHDAEETRDQAIAYLQSRETELTGQLSQTEAELRAAMEGLREARAENEELRAYIEQVDQPQA
jgi:prophage endopeptidase